MGCRWLFGPQGNPFRQSTHGCFPSVIFLGRHCMRIRSEPSPWSCLARRRPVVPAAMASLSRHTFHQDAWPAPSSTPWLPSAWATADQFGRRGRPSSGTRRVWWFHMRAYTGECSPRCPGTICLAEPRRRCCPGPRPPRHSSPSAPHALLPLAPKQASSGSRTDGNGGPRGFLHYVGFAAQDWTGCHTFRDTI